MELNKLEEYREGNQLEAKAAQGGMPDTLWDSYSAFANTDGGCILLGVKEYDDHSLHVIGLKDAEKMKKDFWNGVNNRQKISVNLMTERRVRIENVDGKDIIVLEVPRAERTSRPVFKGMDPRKGTYRRNHEGDYLCSLEEVSAMFRDAALDSQDAKVLKKMDLTVFCQDSIRGYRQVFQNIHPNHTWNRLEDEVFLRRIGASAMGDDGGFHPTAAGLLVFGYENEIVREFPQYFLDYQENRQMATTRWTDRIVSSSGDWSGNVFDFVYKVVPKLTAELKVPFVMRGMQRVDDTPVHKILREAITNACAHADFYGRRGLVISKNSVGFSFANPGSMRVAKKEAIEGGVSDPRNGVMLKIFSLINYGERAGSGLNSIFHVWNHVYHTPAEIHEDMGVDRVTVTLPNGGHEQDVKAMLELYDHPEELTFPEEGVSEYVSGNGEDVRNDVGLSEKISEKQNIMLRLSEIMSEKMSERLSEIIMMAKSQELIAASDVFSLLSVDERQARRYLNRLVDLGFLEAEGVTKNKKYRYKRGARE
ncbi:MAG: putative DNA binding domain-containing protein [Bacteroidales bacterium]|nr:putative DNA binding domain-containing protein [Bacteroidales bacterium]